MNWLEIATNPEETIAKYKDIVVKEGTKLALIHVGSYVFLSWLITDFVVRKYARSRG